MRVFFFVIDEVAQKEQKEQEILFHVFGIFLFEKTGG